MRRRVGLLIAMAALLALPSTVGAHLDHAPPGVTPPSTPSPAFQSGGEDADWELVATLPTGNPHSDIDFFTQGGNTFMSAGVLAVGPNQGGQTIAQLTDGGTVNPRVIGEHPSAACGSRPDAATGLQHDVEATPKGNAILNTFNPKADRRDTQLLLDTTDQRGRCHDQGNALGLANAPRGGLEIIDVTDPAKPKEIGLTSHIGEAHTVNIDPKRPHIAYAVTSASTAVDETGKRANEDPASADRFNLDGFEVVDLSSCMNFPAGTDLQTKRDRCRPEVFRYRYPSVAISQGHTNKSTVFGCHELEIYPDDRLTCGSGAALMVFDMSQSFDANGRPQGTPLDCRVRDSSNGGASAPFTTGAKITDCVDGDAAGNEDLTIPNWIAAGSPSLGGVRHVGSVFHQGRNNPEGNVVPAFDSTEDIDFNHEAEYTTSGRYLLATDERGGGVLPPDAGCSPGVDNPIGNGGVHAYRADRLRPSTPGSADEAFEAYARTSQGGKSIYRSPVRTQPQATLCTAHVLQQIPGQNRIFMGWYSQGTQVIDFTENPDGTLDFKEAGFFIPANANTWVSHIFKAQRNPDGTFTYWGATGDFNLGAAGRNAIDVYKVTLPAAPDPQGGTGTRGAPALAAAGGGAGDEESCATISGFRSVNASRRGRGLRISFARRNSRSVQVDVFRQTRGKRSITRLKRIKQFRNRKRSFTWRAKGVRNGYYVVRYRIGLAGGEADVRRVAVQRRNGRFNRRPAFQRNDSCSSLIGAFRLNRPVFGGKQNRKLFASFRLNDPADVKITVLRKGKVVATTQRRRFQDGNGRTLRLRPRTKGRGDYRVTISAERGNRTATATLTTRRL